MCGTVRVGLIVPSSNTTMETELPALLRRREAHGPQRFTFHSSRMAMRRVTLEELARMDRDSDRCARELADAGCAVVAYACLIAIMATGPGSAEEAEQRLARVLAEHGDPTPVVTSAGALVGGIRALGARRVALVAPYPEPLTRLVIAYLERCGITVVDAASLGIADNREVGALDPFTLVDVAAGLRLEGADAVVLSACVQMPSLPAIPIVEERLGLPVLSAATATVYELLARLGLPALIPGAGRLLQEEQAAGDRDGEEQQGREGRLAQDGALLSR